MFSFQYKDWRCISRSECLKKKYYVNTASDINLEMHYKIYDEKCIMECPVDTKETADGKSCEVSFPTFELLLRHLSYT